LSKSWLARAPSSPVGCSALAPFPSKLRSPDAHFNRFNGITAMVEKDLYTVLGVEPDASDREIREAYIRISRVIHPDRFNPQEQPLEWRQANEMLREANRAYEILRNPEKRAQFDASRVRVNEPRRQQQREQPRSEPAAGRSRTEGARTRGPAHGAASFDRLPHFAQIRLRERQEGIRQDQSYVDTAGAGWNYFWIVVLCSWFWLLFAFAQDNRWTGSAVFWLSAITVAVGILIGRNVVWIWQWRKSVLKCRLYVTPLYLIETYLERVRWWPLWKLEDLKVTHNYRNGSYQHTDLKLVFAEGAQDFVIRSKNGVEKLLDGLRYFDRELRLAASRNDWDYFASNDEFHGVVAGGISRRRPGRATAVAYGVPLAVGMVFMIIAYDLNAANPTLTGVPPQYTSQSSTYSNNAANAFSDAGYPAAENTFNAAPQPLPTNGSVLRYGSGEPVAPLEIRTRGQDRHYFVKVVDHVTGEPVATMFVRGGQTAEALVPLGSYRVKYATGETWYGEDYLFGPETSYSEAAERFDFVNNGYQYSGYTLELFLQQNGNLQTNRISPETW
jgi:DnaJ-domain-containing protein 1